MRDIRYIHWARRYIPAPPGGRRSGGSFDIYFFHWAVVSEYRSLDLLNPDIFLINLLATLFRYTIGLSRVINHFWSWCHQPQITPSHQPLLSKNFFSLMRL